MIILPISTISPEPALYNFDIGVSNSLSFEPGTFTPCTHYNGNAMGGASLNVVCDEVVTGRYVKIHMPGDGFAGNQLLIFLSCL